MPENSSRPDISNFLKPKTTFRNLKCYQKAEAIYDLTFFFTKEFLSKSDRTVDQMVQAARSGKQNIVEGRCAATTSRETEIKLYNVARASLQELLIDYEDYLRTRHLEQWTVNHPRRISLSNITKQHNDSAYYMNLAPKCKDFEIANLCITLIYQVDSMLSKLIDYAKEDFLKNGGAKEEMYRTRLNYRNSIKNQNN